jgi:hypothetical protein
MRWHPFLVLFFVLGDLAGAATAESFSGSWIFRPSEYSHDPEMNVRVTQYAQPVTPVFRGDPNYQQSAYRHNESSIHVGSSSDHMHIVETWGAGEWIRPYGEWEYPFRPGATPYGPWGNPQGPWTTPFGSWVNPYGLGHLPIPPWVNGLALPNQPLAPMPAPAAPTPMPPMAPPGPGQLSF